MTRYENESECPVDVHEHAPEHCPLSAVATPKEGADPKFLADCEIYFSHFVKPIRDEAHGGAMRCFHCGEYLTGFESLLLGRGGFEWGITHGEGHCANCRWPARGHHFAKAEDGSELFTLHNFVLQYHPDFVERKSVKAA